MICKQCGAELPNRAKFCTECGADLSDPLDERREPADDAAADEAEPAPDSYPSDEADAADEPSQAVLDRSPNNRPNRRLLMGLLLCGIALLLAVLMLLLRGLYR